MSTPLSIITGIADECEKKPEPRIAFCPACFVEVTPEQADQQTRDARRYRWLRNRQGLAVFTGERIRFRPFDCPHEIEVGQIGATDLDEAIDAQLAKEQP